MLKKLSNLLLLWVFAVASMPVMAITPPPSKGFKTQCEAIQFLIYRYPAFFQGLINSKGLLQGPGLAGFASTCTAPTGTNYTETWGDSATLCWTAGPSTCSHTYTNTNAGASIVSSPAGAPANTACANSLQMVFAAGTATYLTSPTFTAISSNFDAIGTIDVTSGISLGNSNTVLCFGVGAFTCDLSGAVAAFAMSNPSGTQTLHGLGTAAGADINITSSAWHTFDLHRDTTAANCSLAVDGGTAQTFTCNTGNPTVFYLGTEHFGTNAATAVIGNLYF